MRVRVSGGPYAPSLPGPANPFVLTSAPNGGNNPWVTPGAVYVASVDKTLLTWVDGSGNVEGGHWNHSSEAFEGPYTIHASFEADAHTSPAIIPRASDGKVVAVYTKHNATPINARLSTNANDLSAWGSATNLDSQLGAARYTDNQMFERSGDLWMVYRDEQTVLSSRWDISSCSAASPTSGWSSQALIYRLLGTRTYLIAHYDPVNDRLHYIATNAASAGFTKVGHFYRDMTDGTHHKTDGTLLAAQITTFAEMTEIHSGTGPAFGINMTSDASGNVYVALWDDLDYYYLRLEGTTWTETFLASAGVGYSYSNDGNTQPWGMCVDDGDPNIVWLLIDDDGVNPQLWMYETDDEGVTFTPTQVTDDLTGDQTTLIAVRNPAAGLRAIWQSGPWTSYTNWNQGLMGVGT